MISARRVVLLAAVMSGLAGAWSPVAAQAPRGQVLPGGKSNQPVNITAAKLDYFDKEQKLVYTGDVVATQGDSRLKASALVIYLLPKEDGAASGTTGNTQVRRMEAAGPVTMTSKDQVGTGESGIYEKGDNKVTLIGNVVLTQGPNVTKGDKLVYDLTTAQAHVSGTHVVSMFVPNSGGGASAPEKLDARSESVQGVHPGRPLAVQGATLTRLSGGDGVDPRNPP